MDSSTQELAKQSAQIEDIQGQLGGISDSTNRLADSLDAIQKMSAQLFEIFLAFLKDMEKDSQEKVEADEKDKVVEEDEDDFEDSF